MGAKDTVTIRYIQQSAIFADVFNYFLYGGEQVIDPDSLVELDTREIDVPYGGAAGAEQPVQRIRDVIKSVVTMTNRRTAFLLLGIEAQNKTHLAMPVRNMMYDALQYTKQVERAIASHRESGDYRGAGSDEYLSGFMREDHLIPVVTLVLYFGAEAWDGPLSIHKMFKLQDEHILAYVPDYKINLIAPAAIPDEDFDKFSTSLKEVLAFIKYSKDARKLKRFIDSDPGVHEMGRAEVDVLNSCINAKLSVKEDEEAIDVCEAIQAMIDEATREAVAAKEAAEQEARAAKEAAEQEARAAREAAEQEARAAVEQEILEKKLLLCNNVKNLVSKTTMTLDEVMDVLEISAEDREELLQLL